MKLNPKEAEAFQALRNSIVHDVMERELDDLRDSLMTMEDPVKLRQVQGAARKIREILGNINDATPGKRQ